MRVAAIQQEALIADVEANLAACERLAGAAADAGAELIALPEFFTTGMAFDPRLVEAALPPDGAATELLCELARRHRAFVGGSFLCRDPDGEIRNAYLLATPDGEIAGRHDKDLPTMWESCFYVGGGTGDEGAIEAADGLTVGVALCWELMRSQTARRLRGRVDLIIGGSAWWTLPRGWRPRAALRRMEAANAATARAAVESFAGLVGAPVVHAAQAGPIDCALPGLPLRYRGRFQGGAAVVAADGTVLAWRGREEGEGVAIADVEPGRRPPTAEVPDSYWLHRRGAIPALAWTAQGAHGRRWYRRHARAGPRAVEGASR